MRKHIFYNTVNFQPVTFRILFFRGIQTLYNCDYLEKHVFDEHNTILRPFCRAADWGNMRYFDKKEASNKSPKYETLMFLDWT